MVLVTFYDFLKLEPGMPIDVVKPWKMYSAYFTGMVYSYGILTTRAVKDEWGKAITVPVGHEHKCEPNHLCGILEDEELGLVMSKGAIRLDLLLFILMQEKMNWKSREITYDICILVIKGFN